MAFLTIIVPVYNTEKYLPELLDSIIAQSYEDWLCIIVNDGSTDGSQNIIDKYCALDSRFKAYYKENEGCLNLARKFGLEKVDTEFSTHLDSDDFIEPQYLEKLVSRQKETNADCVVGRIIGCLNELEGEGYRVPLADFNMSQVVSGKEAFKMTIGGWQIPGCGALYRTSLTRVAYYGNDVNYDEFTNRQIYFYAKTVAFTDAHYFYRSNSGTSETFSQKTFTRANVDKEIEDFIHLNYPDDDFMQEGIARQRLFNMIYFVGEFILEMKQFSKMQRKSISTLLQNNYSTLRKHIIKKTLPKHFFMIAGGWHLFIFTSTSYVAIKRFNGKKYYYK